MKVIPVLTLAILELATLPMQGRGQDLRAGDESIFGRAAGTGSYIAFMDTLRKNRDNRYVRLMFDDEEALLDRTLEFGLHHHCVADERFFNLYRIGDTIISFRLDIGKPQTPVYDSVTWRRWNAQVAELYGNVDSLPIDSSSAEDYALLSDHMSGYPCFGFQTGIIGSTVHERKAARRLACKRDVAALRKILRSPNLEGRIFALEALYALKATGVDVGDDLDAFRERFLALNPVLRVCNGCLTEILPFPYVLDHFFDPSNYFDEEFWLGYFDDGCTETRQEGIR